MNKRATVSAAVSIAAGALAIGICIHLRLYHPEWLRSGQPVDGFLVLASVLSISLPFIGAGLLMLKGLILPYYATNRGSYERAKTTFAVGMLGAPFMIFLTAGIVKYGSNAATRILWFLVAAMLVWDFIKAARQVFGKRTT